MASSMVPAILVGGIRATVGMEYPLSGSSDFMGSDRWEWVPVGFPGVGEGADSVVREVELLPETNLPLTVLAPYMVGLDTTASTSSFMIYNVLKRRNSWSA